MTRHYYLSAQWRAIPSLPNIKDGAVTYSVISEGKWGGENTPVLIATKLDEDIANHIVLIHNRFENAR